MLHAWLHSRLARVRSWTSHTWVCMMHALRGNTAVKVARGHHLACSSVRATASQSRGVPGSGDATVGESSRHVAK
jgi:hypothetical protein